MHIVLMAQNAAQAWVEAVLGYTVAWGDTAAWLQAAGAILALAIAIALPRWDGRRRRRVFRATVLAYASLIRDGVVTAAIYQGVYAEVADKLSLEINSVEVSLPTLIDTLRNLPLAQLESAPALEAAVRLAGAANTFVSEWRKDVAVKEAEATLINGYIPARFAADQVKLRYTELERALHAA